MRAGEQVDDIEIAGMGEIPPAQAAKAEHHQFSARDDAVFLDEDSLRRGHRHANGGLCRMGQRRRDRQRIMRRLDQLHAESEARFARDHANPVEYILIIGTERHRPGRHARGQRTDPAGQVESRTVDQRVEQFGATAQLVRQRGCKRQDVDQLRKQGRPGAQQAEEVNGRRDDGEHLLPPQDRAVRLRRFGQCRQQFRQHVVEGLPRPFAAQGTIAAIAPPFDTRGKRRAVIEAERRQPRRQSARAVGHAGCGGRILLDQGVEAQPHLFRHPRQSGHQRVAIRQPVQPGDIVQRLAIGQFMRLLVLHHLQAMFDTPQPVVGFAQGLRVLRRDTPRTRQRIESGPCTAQPQGRVAPAMHQLMRLGEEFHFANAAAPVLDAVIRPRNARAVMPRPDPQSQAANGVDRPEIEAAPPDETVDRRQEIAARRDVAGAGARTDESRAFPGKGAGFVMHQRRRGRDCQRADLARRAQPQIDAEDIAFRRVPRQHLHDIAGVTLRRLAGFVTRAARQGVGIVEQDRIDIGTVVQFTRAMLAERQGDEPCGLRIGNAAQDGGGNCPVQRAIGKGGQFHHHALQRECARQIADRQRDRQPELFAPQGDGSIADPLARLSGQKQRILATAFAEQGGDVRQPVEPAGEERGMVARPVQRALPVCCLIRIRHVPALPQQPWRGNHILPRP